MTNKPRFVAPMRLERDEYNHPSTVRMRCQIEGSSGITPQWFKGDNQIKQDQNHTVSMNDNITTLTIKITGEDDEGTYCCKLVGSDGALIAETRETIYIGSKCI